MNIFQRAHLNLPLSPTERALLKLFYMALGSAILSTISAIGSYISSSNHAISWSVVLPIFIGSFSLALVESLRKYVTAHGDGPIGTALTLLSDVLGKQQKQADAAQKLQHLQNVSTTNTSAS